MIASTHFSRSRTLRRWAAARGLIPATHTDSGRSAAQQLHHPAPAAAGPAGGWPLWNPNVVDRLRTPLTRFRD